LTSLNAPQPAEPAAAREAEGGPGTAERRIAAVRRILTAGLPPESLDRLTRLAAELLETEYAQVSLLADEQIVASVYGLDLEPEDRVGPAADSLCSVTVSDGAAVAIGDTAADDRVGHLPPVVSGLVGAYLGIPLTDRHGLSLGALCVYDRKPRTWTARDVAILSELAASVVAELELRALAADLSTSSARLDLTLSAADIGSFDLEVASGHLTWDDRLVSLFGYDRGTFVEHWDSFADRAHPDDLPRVMESLTRAIETVGNFSAEYRIVLPDGATRWVQARGQVLPDLLGRPGRLLGVAYDVTELRSTRDRLAGLLESMTDAFYSLDASWHFSYVNGQAERVLGRGREDLLGKVIWDEFPEAFGTVFQANFERAVETGEMVTFEEFYPPLDGWFELRAWPSPDGLSVYFHEITARRQAQEEREAAVEDSGRAYAAAEAANTRLALLADASSRLSASLEPRAVLQTLSDLVVPRFGQWVVVALRADTAAPMLGRDDTGDADRVYVVHLAHENPEQEDALRTLVGSLPLSVRDEVGVGAVIGTGVSEWLPQVPDTALVADAPDEETLARLRAVEVGATLTVPLVSRGRRLGAIWVSEPSGGSLDRALLFDVAARAAVALDNALLYGAERRNGITLQRSLLPQDLPEVPGLELAYEYLPGATGAQVGGDWYQGIRLDDDLILAIGDVMGHGMRSAARMGQLRAIVATLALEGHRPGELLRRLSQSSDLLLDLELATLLVAHYSVAERTLTVASAGHPPPLLAEPGGEPWFVDLTPGPPIGTFPGDYPETVVTLPEDATLVLYTDGLVENRDDSLDHGLERLRRSLRGQRLAPKEVCAHVLKTMGRTQGADDDVAMLVMSQSG
jgi:PAS domain S-box-containing protein